MKATIVLDDKATQELEELSKWQNLSKSEVVRGAIDGEYLKERRAREGVLVYTDLYYRGIVTKDMLFLLLPEKDAEAIIGGVKIGKEAAGFAKKLGI